MKNKKTVIYQFKEKLELIGYARRTIEGYCYELKEFFEYLSRHENIQDVNSIKREHLIGYQSWIHFGGDNGDNKITPRSMNNKLQAIICFYRRMYEEGLVENDLSGYITLKRVKKNPPKNVPSQNQIKKLLDSIEPEKPLEIRDKAILELLYATGIRSMELRHLKLSDWDMEKDNLFIHGKGAKDRIVPIGSWVIPYLREYVEAVRPLLVREPTELLFLSKNGRIIHKYNLGTLLKKYTERAEIKMNVHAFRHCCATHLLESGADIRYVQELLGHADLSTTQIYTKVDITSLKKAYMRFHPRENKS